MICTPVLAQSFSVRVRLVARATGSRGAEIAWIGDVVQGHQQRGFRGAAGGLEQIVGVRVAVGRHLQRHALM
jgi:hypothetical protein